jgi:hypothetical protein
METTFIYALQDPNTNEIRYVGKSNEPSRRLSEHLLENTNTYKVNWIKSLGEVHPNLITLDEVPMSEWGFWESYYIDLFRSWGFRLVNLTNGGDGVSNMSTEMKNRISNTLKTYYNNNGHPLKGKPKPPKESERLRVMNVGKSIHTEEYKKSLAERMMGNTHTLGNTLTEEHKKKISESQLGVPKHSEETKRSISEKNSGQGNGMYGKKHTKESLKKISESSRGENHNSVKLTEKDVLLIREYHRNKTYNQKEMSKMFKVSYSTIQKIVHRKLWIHI